MGEKESEYQRLKEYKKGTKKGTHKGTKQYNTHGYEKNPVSVSDSESESEKKEKKQKINEGKKIAINSIKKLSETIEQELAAEFIVRENSNYKLVGKTNKSNLVFEHNGEQIRVTPKGEVL
jgi:hypothetical protein